MTNNLFSTLKNNNYEKEILKPAYDCNDNRKRVADGYVASIKAVNRDKDKQTTITFTWE